MSLADAIRLPAPPPDPPTRPIPVLIVLAPVAASLVIFAFTGSPLTLAFAALGPVMGLASWAEGVRSSRRLRRRGRREFERQLAQAQELVERRREETVAARRRRDPVFADLLAGARPSPLDALEPESPLPWVLGIAELPSGIRVEGGGPHPELEAVARRAARVEGSPVVVEAPRLALRGRLVTRASVARALRCSLAARGLDADAIASRLLELDPDGPAVPADCPELILDDPAPGRARLIRPEGELVLEPDRASTLEHARWRAEHEGPARQTAAPSAWLALPDARRDRGLAAVIGASEGGPAAVDLVGDGPHAVIGGTTGSGKSELLLTWTVSLAAAYPPEHLAFLALDFKGGATFDQLADLPHCAGLLTDLDSDGDVERAVVGLRAELRRRESLLRDARARSLGELSDGPPRLVVLVDEFQALIDASPDLHEAFADLASRGRSLGIHLILCTQRPSSAVRESLLANCAIRCCLRVTSSAESQALLGSAVAARIPPSARGRAYLDLGSGAISVQTQRVAAADVERVRARWADREQARTVVAPPLPARLAPGSVEGLGRDGAFALADEPASQRRPLIRLERGQRLAIIGAARSGRSSALAAILAARRADDEPVLLGRDPGTAWARLERAERCVAASRPTLLLADDVDALLRSFDEVRRHEFAERLSALLRSGGDRLIAAIAGDRLAPPWSQLAAQCERALVLRARSRQDHLLAGGQPPSWRADLPPGRGELDGLAVQVAEAPPLEIGRERAVALEPGAGPIAVLSRRPDAARQLAEAGWAVVPIEDGHGAERADEPRRRAVVGDVEAWNLRHGSLGRAAAVAPLVLDAIGPGELRVLLRGASTPMPVDDPHRQCVLRTPDGRQRLALWPGRPPSEPAATGAAGR